MTSQSDYLNPADMDWTTVNDTTLYHAAKAGIPQALAEIARREATTP